MDIIVKLILMSFLTWQLMDINESPVYVLLDPSINHAQKDLPVTIYESGNMSCFFSSYWHVICLQYFIFLIILVLLLIKLVWLYDPSFFFISLMPNLLRLSIHDCLSGACSVYNRVFIYLGIDNHFLSLGFYYIL